MNKISELIIRALSPKPKKGEILIMPFIKKAHAEYKKASPPDTGADAVSTSGDAPVKPLPGQLHLDEVLPDMTEKTFAIQLPKGVPSETTTNMTTNDIDKLW